MGEDGLAALAAQPRQQRRLRQVAALRRYAGQQHCRHVAGVEHAARCGADPVAEHLTALRQLRLTQGAGRHLPVEDGVEVAADVCRRLRVEGQGNIQHPADRLLGEVFIGGAKAAGEDQQVRPLPGDGDRLLQPLWVVAHHGMVQHVHTYGGQRLRQLLRISVGDVAQQQLCTHGDDLCVIGHRITSFDDLLLGGVSEGTCLRRHTFCQQVLFLT